MSALSEVQALPTILERLKATFPKARYELNWENPLQLLVATILAAQCTDERVNQVTPALFARYPDARAYAEADLEELAEAIRPTGFYRNKARAIQSACQALVEHFRGEVPRTMEEMLTLPGVARKTANVVLNNAFQIPTGVIVDTHVARVSQRLGLTRQKKPERIEQDLMRIVPQEEWVHFGPAMVLLGRYTCTANAPRCPDCFLNDLCPRIGVDEPTAATAPPAEEPAREASSSPPAKKAAAKKPVSSSLPKTGQDLPEQLPADWRKVLAEEFQKPYFRQ
ncbi:MAG: endonuclease III, partial [Planctomycetes bacterium]|nr:endonuclease III [Planctomycetota bacterium]